MRIAITGGTGLIGGSLARALAAQGHSVVRIARRGGYQADLTDPAALAKAFAGCDAVAHCAGINRELGAQTYASVHVAGTDAVVRAATAAGIRRIALISFLRARPHCGSGYHESKWAAEEIFRRSGLDFTILKCGVVYGRGDHLLDHISHTLHTVPLFATVGLRGRPMAPVAAADVVRILTACLIDGRLRNQTVAVTGPERLSVRELVTRIAHVVERRVFVFPMPVLFHRALAYGFELAMKVPLVSLAQVRILSEGIVDPAPGTSELPPDLRPLTPFTGDQIRAGLPDPAPFGCADLRCCS